MLRRLGGSYLILNGEHTTRRGLHRPRDAAVRVIIRGHGIVDSTGDGRAGIQRTVQITRRYDRTIHSKFTGFIVL